MTFTRRLAFASFALAVGLPAAAQQADVAATASTGSPNTATHQVPQPTNATGTILFNNGAYVTGIGNGAGGADTSEIEPGLTLFGWGQQFGLGYRMADDFSVPAAASWTIDEVRWHAYQTNAPTTGTITGIYQEWVAGASPNGGVIAGDTTTNRMTSTQWTGVYRVTTTGLTSSARAIMEVMADATYVGALGTGQYWIRSMCDGSAASGPWCPVTNPWDASDNIHQELGIGNGFNPTTQGFGGTPGDTPFDVIGRSSGGPPVTTFCTQTKTTSVAGCLPVLTASGTNTTTDTWDTSQVPFGAGISSTVGLHIYVAGPGIGQSAFSTSVSFGTLCLQGFFRAGPPVTSSGASNSCTGSFSYGFGANFATLQAADPLLIIGNDINVQGWYRDPPNSGTANFTNAMWYTMT